MDASVNGVVNQMAQQENEVSLLPLYPVDDYEDVIYQIYKRICDSDLSRIFWFMPEQISLRTFLDYMDDRRLLIGSFDQEMELVGIFWLENMVTDQLCEMGGWLPFSSRGGNAPDLMRQALAYVHDTMKIRSVMVKTPWKTAYRLCCRVNMDLVAKIENYPLPTFDTTMYIMRHDDARRK